ncbi:hypothetical protein EDB92DRAFT_209262 [Lactarius akahatsu]|uniref:Uncharacterized protein n=1 Tax=Lactarius akahatsu TaxID=416441 RepID=A0AAD4LLR1_9AGAM|nr:hypothetical protein EDB92DRAFT_209262 [Lactarius akahatsu]
MVSIRPFMRALFSFVPAKQKKDWQTIAWESKEATFRAERRHHQSEQKYYREREARSLLDYKFGALQKDMLRLHNNLNLQIFLGRIQGNPQGPRDKPNAAAPPPPQGPGIPDMPCKCNRPLPAQKGRRKFVSELVVRDSEHTITEVAALKYSVH